MRRELLPWVAAGLVGFVLGTSNQAKPPAPDVRPWPPAPAPGPLIIPGPIPLDPCPGPYCPDPYPPNPRP